MAGLVVAVTFVLLLCAAAVRATPAVIMVPLQQELGWSRALIAGSVSVSLVIYGLVGPFSAAVMERFGVRRTILCALTVMATGVALTNLMVAPWQFYACWGVLVGVASGTMGSALSAMIVQRWFVARRGLVIGILTASAAAGQLVFLPVMASFVESDGWRSVARVIPLVVLGLVPIATLVVRDRPEDVGLRPYGADPAAPAEVRAVGNPLGLALGALRRASRHRDFWLLVLSFFICGATTSGLIGTHLVPACMDHGIPEVKAASLVATMGVFDLVGTTASGWLTAVTGSHGVRSAAGASLAQQSSVGHSRCVGKTVVVGWPPAICVSSNRFRVRIVSLRSASLGSLRGWCFTGSLAMNLLYHGNEHLDPRRFLPRCACYLLS